MAFTILYITLSPYSSDPRGREFLDGRYHGFGTVGMEPSSWRTQQGGRDLEVFVQIILKPQKGKSAKALQHLGGSEKDCAQRIVNTKQNPLTRAALKDKEMVG